MANYHSGETRSPSQFATRDIDDFQFKALSDRVSHIFDPDHTSKMNHSPNNIRSTVLVIGFRTRLLQCYQRHKAKTSTPTPLLLDKLFQNAQATLR